MDSVSSGAPTLAVSRICDEGARARIIGASVQPCTCFGTGRGWWVWLCHARRPQAPISGPPHRGQPRRGRGNDHHAGVLGFRVDGRSRRAVSGVRGKGAVVAVLAPRRLAERPWSIGEETPRLLRQRGSRSAFGHSSSVEGTPRPQTRAHRSRGGPGKRRGLSVVVCRCKAGPHGETRSARGSVRTRHSEREQRSGMRRPGRSG